MYALLKQIHNINGMLVLTVLLVAVILNLVFFLMKKPYHKLAKISALVGLILTHLQIVLGFVLYFISPVGFSNFSGEAMKETTSRLYLVEHPIGMIVAAVLITIGYKATKNVNLNDNQKYIKVLINYLLALAIVSYLIPWFVWK